MDEKTNFDSLKEMAAEDFAVWIGTVAEGCDLCPHHHDCLYDDEYSEQCEALWLRWLNSPAEVQRKGADMEEELSPTDIRMRCLEIYNRLCEIDKHASNVMRETMSAMMDIAVLMKDIQKVEQ